MPNAEAHWGSYESEGLYIGATLDIDNEVWTVQSIDQYGGTVTLKKDGENTEERIVAVEFAIEHLL